MLKDDENSFESNLSVLLTLGRSRNIFFSLYVLYIPSAEFYLDKPTQ